MADSNVHATPIRKSVSATGVEVLLAGNSTLATIPIHPGATHLYFQVTNSGANAFDAFIVSRRCHVDGDYEVIANAAGDFTAPQSPIIECQGAPVTLAAAATVHIRMTVEATDAVLVQASNGTGDQTAAIYWSVE